MEDEIKFLDNSESIYSQNSNGVENNAESIENIAEMQFLQKRLYDANTEINSLKDSFEAEMQFLRKELENANDEINRLNKAVETYTDHLIESEKKIE